MSKSKASKFKKHVWGCPDSLEGLGSKRSVSKAEVGSESDVQSFTFPDAKHQHDLSVIASLSSDDNNFVDANGGVTHSGGGSSIGTRYFYSKAVDKKCVQSGKMPLW